MKILAHALTLAPLGGVELCTLEDSLALADRGRRLQVMYGGDGELRSAYQAAGIGLSGPHQFEFSPRHVVADLRAFAGSMRSARSYRPDVLWLNRFEHIVWGQVIARTARCGLVCHLHGPPMFHRMRQLGLGVRHFVAVSDFVRDAYLERGVPADRISVVPNALPPAKYPFGGEPELIAARHALGLPLGRPIVLWYGQMTVDKGALTLAQAWRGLAQRNPDALLVVVDSAPMPDPLARQEFDALDPDSYRSFPRSADVIPFLHACDVVVFPTWLPEAFGRVVLEGMAAGRPVVSSRVGAVPELLGGPMDRFLVPPRQVEPLVEAVDAVLDWRRREPDLGRSCANWVREHFDYDEHVNRLDAILADAAR